jgi:hypothetical protein
MRQKCDNLHKSASARTRSRTLCAISGFLSTLAKNIGTTHAFVQNSPVSADVSIAAVGIGTKHTAHSTWTLKESQVVASGKISIVFFSSKIGIPNWEDSWSDLVRFMVWFGIMISQQILLNAILLH